MKIMECLSDFSAYKKRKKEEEKNNFLLNEQIMILSIN